MINSVNRKLNELINENHVFASVLYYFGIEFYKYTDKTLKQVCLDKGLDVATVVSKLESSVKPGAEENVELENFPIDLLVEYLKHKHHIFVKEKLPYFGRLVDNLSSTEESEVSIVKDLKFIFPLFVEDFIKHIYEEEDTLFNYIQRMEAVFSKKLSFSKFYFEMEKYSLMDFAVHHSGQDDEFEGLRRVIQDYPTASSNNLCLKVIFSELKNFDAELIVHAKIEDDILLPKAINLEKKLKNLVQKKIKYN